ncbi:hypothetical protein PV327_011139 [Microctonus hyperodae]|uniref:Uncharacterized protein n=1 Tax=Microctonus hyperodae TaxID=165561 RepID=A0AA39EYJ8_MICHY|nr:hypothetical protein PV327_011139 [Microctonus hyperodae]
MCTTILKLCKSGKCDKQRLPFLPLMVWHIQKYHKPEDCYFCQTNIIGHHYKTRDRIKYANVLTVTKPVNKNSQDEPAVEAGLTKVLQIHLNLVKHHL